MGTTSEKLSYLNTTKTKIKESINLGGANLTNETFREYADEIKDRYLYFMNNGLEVVWNNWNKVSGTGTTLSLNNTEEAPMKLEYKGNTSQNGTPTPSSPIPVQVVSGDNSIEVVGKNIFDKNNVNSLVAYIDGSGKIASAAGNYLIWMKVTKNTNYAFKMTQIALSTSSYVDDVQIGLYQNTPVLNATGTRVYSQARSSATEDYTYTTTFNSGTNNYVAIKIANTSRTDTTQTLATLQLEVGTQATTYEEYKSASYPISLGVESAIDFSNSFSPHPAGGGYATYKLNDDNSIEYVSGSSGYGWSYANCQLKATLNAGTYTITSNKQLTKVYDSNNTLLLDVTSTNNYIGTITLSATTQIGLGCKPDATTGACYITINEGSKANRISDTPIELNKIGTYQDKIDKSTGKNLIQTTQFSANNYVSQKLTLSIGNYYVSYTGDTASGLYVRKADGTNPTNGTQVVAKYNSTWLSFTISEDGEYYIQFYLSGSGFTNFKNAMLNEGTTALPYEPYGTSWYLKKEIGKVVLDGSENWTKSAYSDTNYCTFITFDYNNNLGANARYDLLSDYFQNNDIGQAIPTKTGISYIGSSYGVRIAVPYSLASDVTPLKTWLGTNNVDVYYHLATPTYETITDTTLIGQLEAIKKSYEGQTNISQVNNDLPFELDVIALSDGTTQASLLSAPLLGSMSTQEEPETLEEVLEEPEVDSEESL